MAETVKRKVTIKFNNAKSLIQDENSSAAGSKQHSISDEAKTRSSRRIQLKTTSKSSDKNLLIKTLEKNTTTANLESPCSELSGSLSRMKLIPVSKDLTVDLISSDDDDLSELISEGEIDKSDDSVVIVDVVTKEDKIQYIGEYLNLIFISC